MEFFSVDGSINVSQPASNIVPSVIVTSTDATDITAYDFGSDGTMALSTLGIDAVKCASFDIR